jgi:hypothetical protein
MDMKNKVSYCGLLCDGCPVLWATGENNPKMKEKMRTEIAKMSNSLYKTQYTSGDITDCDGCFAENERLFPGCNDCQIRNCARAKNIPNCAWCEDYICETLGPFLNDNQEAKLRLDFIRKMVDRP